VTIPANITPEQPRIVVGVDGSDQSKQALRWAARLAAAYDAELTAIAAWHYPLSYGVGGVEGLWDPQQDASKCLTQSVDEVFGPERPAHLELLVQHGNSAHVLLEQGETALMLVVGSRGHGGFAGLLLGSVSAAVAEHATCPVLVVHGNGPVP
jgi:nucleotide-binding universal stress UspA family protein